MKKLNFFTLAFILPLMCNAGGNIPIMFAVQTLPGAVLKWDYNSYQFDGYGLPAQILTFTLTNYGAQTSGSLTITLIAGDPAYTVVSNNCEFTVLLPSGRCQVDIQFIGPNSVLPSQLLRGTDGTVTAPDVVLTNCNAC